MVRMGWCAGVALGMTVLSANVQADGLGSPRTLPDAVLYRAHVVFGVNGLAEVGPRDACGQPRVADGQDELDRDEWVDPAPQVHGSGLIANCKLTPEPDERARPDRTRWDALRG